jgi:oligoendopeptidase F
MIHRLSDTVICMALLAVSQTQTVAQTRARSEVPELFLWKLEDIYPSDSAWEQAKGQTLAMFDQVDVFKGKVASDPKQLLACLELTSRIDKELSRLYCYASMKSDQDTSASKYLGMKQQMQQIVTDYSSRTSFIDPEVIQMDQATIASFLETEPGLQVYRMYLDNLLRTKAHRLSDKEEKIMAEAGILADGPYSIYSTFSNAEVPYPEIILSDGTQVLLNKAGYAKYRAVPERADREVVFQAFWQTFVTFKQTFATQLNAQVNKDMFYARTRRYDSSLHSALDKNNIPIEVYYSLVRNVTNNLDSFHRYLKLKERMLGVDQIKYSDVYAPVVKGVDLAYTYEKAMALVLDAFKPLGDDYVKVVKHAFDQRWIDVYPTPAKRSGAYSNGDCYDVHPYILLNYNGQYDDVSTLAHELGHTMHSFYSNKTQPYATADYSIFVAEVASTLNEALLMHKVLQTVDNDDVRLSLLMNYLDGIKGTVFRQTQFAEFELAIHEAVENGQPLTGDSLTELYGKILKRYYGHDQGVCHIDGLYCVEWAYIPHFYYNFYVYQYATSFTASTALSEKILAAEPGAVDRYIAFISSGGSDYPINQLRAAGVDMMTSEPFNKTMAAMNRVMDQIEAILDKKGTK